MNFKGWTEREIMTFYNTGKVPGKAKPAKKAQPKKKAKKTSPKRQARKKPPVKKSRATRKEDSPSGLEVRKGIYRKVGEAKRGAARVYLEGEILEKSGFSIGDSIEVEVDEVAHQVTIRLDPAGSRKVSKHRGKAVVDVASKSLKKAMLGADEVVLELGYGRVVFHPGEVPYRLKTRGENGAVGSAFTGAGFMDLAAEQSGYRTTFGIEVDPRFAAMFKANNPQATIVNRPIEQALDLHQKKLETGYGPLFPHVELLVMGVPCDPWSKIRGARADIPTEEHDLYTMTMYAWALIQATNPLNVVIEQVPDYVKDPLYAIFKTLLEKAGYHVTSKVVDSKALGYAAGRSRAYVVATTQKGFSWQKALKRKAGLAKVRDILLPPSHPAITSARTSQGNWFSTKDKSGTGATMRKSWSRAKYRPSFIDPASTKLNTVVKNYYKPAPTGPFVKHPTKKDTYRLLTIEEVKRAHGVPTDYRLPGSMTAKIESLGQGVVVPLIKGIIQALPGGVGSRTITTTGRRLMNPFRVVPLWYGPGPGYANMPLGWFQ